MTEDDPAFARTRKHVDNVRNFSYHLMVYVSVNALLVFIDLRGGANDGFLGLDFALWPILGWGIGIAGHAISVFFGDYRAERVYDRDHRRR